MFKKCWRLEGDEREQCIKDQLEVPRTREDIRDRVAECRDSDAPRECLKEIKDKVHHLIKFRLHHLEEKALRFQERGWVTEDVVVDFIANLDIKKIEFEEAETKEEKRAIILEVRELWKEFISNVDRGTEDEN